MTLYELTGQESGLVVYDGHVMVVNWSHIIGDGMLPFVDPTGMDIIGMPMSDISAGEAREVDDIRDELPGEVSVDEDGQLRVDGMTIDYDYNGDLPGLFVAEDGGKPEPTGGKVWDVAYSGGECKVIAPEWWA